MKRNELFDQLETIIGSSHFTPIERKNGWPGVGKVACSSGSISVAIHVGPVGLSQRGRDDVERRFQNPGKGKPLQTVPGAHSLLIGIWSNDSFVTVERPVLVAMQVTDARKTAQTRQSYFAPLWLLQAAMSSGWAEHQSEAGETILAFLPEAFPAFVEANVHASRISAQAVSATIRASGLLDSIDNHGAKERVRRQTTLLARSSVFSGKVIRAYNGRCSMCGLNATLVEAAHIYPVAAPDSPDEIWNGLCLCRNHHCAFDRNILTVHPETFEISLGQTLLDEAKASIAGNHLVNSTFKKLQMPSRSEDRPSAEMFRLRYAGMP